MHVASPVIDITRSAARRGIAAAREYPWVINCVLLAVSFYALTWLVSQHIGIPIRDPEGKLFGKKRMLLPMILMGAFVAVDVYWRARRMARTVELRRLELMRRIFMERWWWQRAVIAVIGASSFHINYLAYRNLKSYLPLLDYRTYDESLLVLDRLMLFGYAPADVLHELLGTQLTAHVLSTIYLAYVPWVAIGVGAALTFCSSIREGYVYAVAMQWCFILGTLSYYMLPALGPFASAPWQFDDLAYTGVTRVQDALIDHRGGLIADPAGYANVNSIAAFASLHVGVVFMAYLMARYYRNRTLEWAMMAALIPTIIATIYFGWHFLIDDVAGFVIGWLAVVLALRMTYPERNRLPRVMRPLVRRVTARLPVRA